MLRLIRRVWPDKINSAQNWQCWKPKSKKLAALWSSRAVPHHSTSQALGCLTSEFGRDLVYSTRYGCKWQSYFKQHPDMRWQQRKQTSPASSSAASCSLSSLLLLLLLHCYSCSTLAKAPLLLTLPYSYHDYPYHSYTYHSHSHHSYLHHSWYYSHHYYS